MELKALLTKQVGFADESMRVSISSCSSVEELQDKLKAALTLADSRVNDLNVRIFEDTELTSKLSEEELTQAKVAVDYLFPEIKLEDSDPLKENVQLEFSKLMPSGESLTVQVYDIEKYEDLSSTITSVFSTIDNRLFESNFRVMAYEKYLKTIPIEARLKILLIVDALFGKASVERIKAAFDSTQEYIQEQITAAQQQNTINHG